MKRIMLSASLTLALGFVGCGSDDQPTDPGCKGLINLTLTFPGGESDLKSLNAYKTLESTALDPTGGRFVQTDNPPLVTNVVALRAPNQTLSGGAYQVRIVHAASSPSSSNATTQVEVKNVGRATVQSSGAACATGAVTMAAPARMDLCLDLCDAEVRCGKRGFNEFSACQSNCRANADAFAQQQQQWVDTWTAFYKKSNTADAANKAKAQVQSLIGQYESCNFAACSAVEDCGASVLGALLSPQ